MRALLLLAALSAFLPSFVRLFSSLSRMCLGRPLLPSSSSSLSSSSSEKLSSLAWGGWLPSLILLEREVRGRRGVRGR